ncbi:VOC family protein [Permianibacter sp. IMCC34836]|uniref:VOC family protein n=1 Tax=Permianibacter fluminis TaxID=2738515 RepID=UPI001556988B|nr:VOC family protein [Permianibacter fluminis]NQD36969.1 VOC family protein [Permianibacter fluminis]
MSQTNPAQIALGGVFLQADNPAALADWYRKHFGLGFEANGGVHFCSPAAITDIASSGYPVFSVFPRNSEYFKGSALMLNFVVADLRATLARLQAEGVAVDTEIEDGDYGKFGWLTDPAGNRLELWQPPKAV